MDTNHCLLAALGVSHPVLELVRGITASHGLHTKVGVVFYVVISQPLASLTSLAYLVSLTPWHSADWSRGGRGGSHPHHPRY